MSGALVNQLDTLSYTECTYHCKQTYYYYYYGSTNVWIPRVIIIIIIIIIIINITIIIVTIASNDIIRLRNQAINISDRLHVDQPEITMGGIYMQFRLFSFDKFRDTAPSKPEKIRTDSIVFHLRNLKQAFLSLPIVIL